MTIDIEKEDRVVSEFLRSIGPWRKHVVIGGGYALIIYKLYLTDQAKGHLPVGTKDLDTLIPRKIPEASKKDIAKHLTEAGFKQFFKNFDDPASEVYVKEINGSEIEIEFLTDNLAIAGVIAQPLQYLEQSLKTLLNLRLKLAKKERLCHRKHGFFTKG